MKPTQRLSMFDNIHLLKQTELKGLFSDEEYDGLLKELNIESKTKDFSSNSKNKISHLLFDKSYFILKILKTSIEALKDSNHKFLAKGMEWVTFELHDSLIQKNDDKKTLQRIGQIKDGNSDLDEIFQWLEEYSTIKQNQKDEIDNVIQKNNFQEDSQNFNKYAILNVSEENLRNIEEPHFDIFCLEEEAGKENTLSVISNYIFITLGLYSVINYTNLENFLQGITIGYSRNNPYHNDLHAADVEQTCFMYLKYGNVIEKLKLSNLDTAAFLISAIIHDFKHPGVTNPFLINSKNELAIRYNDQSVLENFHIAESFKLIYSDKKYDIFSQFKPDEFKLFRRRIIECILATDMSFHTKQFAYIKAKKEKFSIEDGKNIEGIFDGLDNFNLFSTQQDFLNILLHTADISNPTKPTHVYEKWVDKVMTEFWNQGDKEKELKLPISFLCDRNTTSTPKAQLGFIEGIVFPLLTTVVDFFPGLHFLLDNCNKNKEHFTKLKIEEEKENERKKEEEKKKQDEENNKQKK